VDRAGLVRGLASTLVFPSTQSHGAQDQGCVYFKNTRLTGMQPNRDEYLSEGFALKENARPAAGLRLVGSWRRAGQSSGVMASLT